MARVNSQPPTGYPACTMCTQILIPCVIHLGNLFWSPDIIGLYLFSHVEGFEIVPIYVASGDEN